MRQPDVVKRYPDVNVRITALSQNTCFLAVLSAVTCSNYARLEMLCRAYGKGVDFHLALRLYGWLLSTTARTPSSCSRYKWPRGTAACWTWKGCGR